MFNWWIQFLFLNCKCIFFKKLANSFSLFSFLSSHAHLHLRSCFTPIQSNNQWWECNLVTPLKKPIKLYLDIFYMHPNKIIIIIKQKRDRVWKREDHRGLERKKGRKSDNKFSNGSGTHVHPHSTTQMECFYNHFSFFYNENLM